MSQLDDGSTTGEGVFNFSTPRETQDADDFQETLSARQTVKSTGSVPSAFSTWSSMKPTSFISADFPSFPEEKLAPYLNEAIQTILSIQATLEKVLTLLPKAFDAVETVVEEKMVSADVFAAEAISPLKHLETQLRV